MDVGFTIYILFLVVFIVIPGLSMLKKDNNRCRLTDSQQKDLEDLLKKWDMEDAMAKEEERRKREKES